MYETGHDGTFHISHGQENIGLQFRPSGIKLMVEVKESKFGPIYKPNAAE